MHLEILSQSQMSDAWYVGRYQSFALFSPSFSFDTSAQMISHHELALPHIFFIHPPHVYVLSLPFSPLSLSRTRNQISATFRHLAPQAQAS